MLFSVLVLAIAGTVSAILEQPTPEEICKDPSKCLRIGTFYIIEPTKPKKGEDNISLDFSIYDPNPDPVFQGADQCDVDWKYGTDTFPKSLTACNRAEFSYYIDGFVAIDKTFYVEATHTTIVGTNAVTVYARGKVSLDYIECFVSMSSFKSCQMKQNTEILLVKYTPPAKPAL